MLDNDNGQGEIGRQAWQKLLKGMCAARRSTNHHRSVASLGQLAHPFLVDALLKIDSFELINHTGKLQCFLRAQA